MRRRTCVWQYSRIDNGPGTSFLCIVFNCISVMLFIVQLFRVINWTLIKTRHLILFFSTSFCLFLSSSDLTYHATFNLTLHTPDTDAILICPVLPYPGLSCSALPCPAPPYPTPPYPFLTPEPCKQSGVFSMERSVHVPRMEQQSTRFPYQVRDIITFLTP